jgi:hypothetical protein
VRREGARERERDDDDGDGRSRIGPRRRSSFLPAAGLLVAGKNNRNDLLWDGASNYSLESALDFYMGL